MKRAWNWRLWLGFAVILVAPFAYFLLYEFSRAAFWFAIVLLILGIILFGYGLKCAFGSSQTYRGKIAGPILGTLAILIIGLFSWGSYMMSKAYAAAQHAPRIGDKAPQFAVLDSSGRRLTLAELLSAPFAKTSSGNGAPRGILLVFYRGYW